MTTAQSFRPATAADTVDGVAALHYARPTSVDEVADTLRRAAGHGWSVVPRGAGTKLTWGAPPTSADLILDMSGLNRVIEHEAGDLVVVVEAGVVLDDLQRRLSVSDQRLALDSMVPGATIGGIVSTACSGPRRLGFGTVRDLLIGVTIVRADGVVAKAGGKVVKNVAGYDLAKLFTGAFGTLGVLVQAAFRLHPLPVASRWLETELSEGDLTTILDKVVHSQFVPVAVEVDWPRENRPTVAVLLEGSSIGVARRAAALSEFLPGRLRTVDGLDSPGHRLGFPFGAGDVGLKFTCRLSSVGAVLSAAHRMGVSVRGSAGVGVFYGAVPGSAADPAATITSLRHVCITAGGSLVVMDAPQSVKTAVDIWGPVGGLDLMRSVKEQFDPGGRLSPGRFVGGL